MPFVGYCCLVSAVVVVCLWLLWFVCGRCVLFVVCRCCCLLLCVVVRCLLLLAVSCWLLMLEVLLLCVIIVVCCLLFFGDCCLLFVFGVVGCCRWLSLFFLVVGCSLLLFVVRC